MSAVLREFDVETSIEARIVRLEEKTDHIQSDITEMKGDIRRIDAKADAIKDSVAALRVETKDSLAALRGEMNGGLAVLRGEMNGGLAALRVEMRDGLAVLRGEMNGGLAALRVEMKDSLAALKVGRMFDRVWWLLISGGLLAVVARAFKWI